MNSASQRQIAAGVSRLVVVRSRVLSRVFSRVFSRALSRVLSRVLSIVLSLGFFSAVQADTIVRVSTSMGDYSIELLDDIAPITVQNFLNYVSRDDFNGTYLHRVEDGFVVQGGAYRFQSFVGPIDIPLDSPIVNEFSESNVRGTVAMAKFDGDPDSATNQWFVNLADNTSLDTSNGGFTVFGRVLGEGMVILDAIDALPTVTLGAKASNAPYTSAIYESPTKFVYQNVEVTQRFSSAPHVFESATGLLITSVNINAGAEIISMNFNVVPHPAQFIIQANVLSVIPRRESFAGIATYATADMRLRIPTLEANLNGTVSIVSNAVFVLSNAELLQFTLESYGQ